MREAGYETGGASPPMAGRCLPESQGRGSVAGDAPGEDMKGRGHRQRLATVLAAVALAAAACAGAGGVAPDDTAGAGTTSTSAPVTITVPAATTSSSSSTSTSTTARPPTTTTTAAPATTSTLPSWWREVTVDDPLRVWVIGDSLAGPVGNALAGRVREAGLIRVQLHFESGTGLASPSYFDWPGFVADNLAAVDPDVVVVILGANDAQGLSSAEGRLEYGTAEWDARYRDLVGGFMDQLLAVAERVYWVGLPTMNGTGYNGRMRHVSSILLWEASLRFDARFIEAYTLFQGDDGGFAFELPDESGVLVTVRASDGIHYSGAGADRMARRILEVLETDWRLPAG